MTIAPPRKFWHLDADGRMTPGARDFDWRVVAADKHRVDSSADYLFCAPDFLFPAEGVDRALRLEVDPTPRIAPKPARPARRRRVGSRGASRQGVRVRS